ncbi:MAG TPA: hypothetical protein VFJ17_08605 [Mycobacteriales bacterium]|jgi:hypothetical protein|nr:hypothetical protein [Mycobacteriales bacterium]
MTQTSTSRRVATVSGGALLLCLSFGGTALAATAPTTSSDLGPVSTITDPLPLPSPTATTDPVQLVTTTVQQVSQTAGVPVPTATPTTTPAPAPSGGKTSGSTQKVPTTTTKLPGGATRQGKVLGTQRTRPALAPTSIASLQLGGLRGSTPVPPVSNPVVAPQQSAVLAAGQTPVLAPKAGGLIGGGSNDGRAPRGLFIALATMVIGGLAAGHVKVIQDRLRGVTTG